MSTSSRFAEWEYQYLEQVYFCLVYIYYNFSLLVLEIFSITYGKMMLYICINERYVINPMISGLIRNFLVVLFFTI